MTMLSKLVDVEEMKSYCSKVKESLTSIMII